jgi:hypothetical protein
VFAYTVVVNSFRGRLISNKRCKKEIKIGFLFLYINTNIAGKYKGRANKSKNVQAAIYGQLAIFPLRDE